MSNKIKNNFKNSPIPQGSYQRQHQLPCIWKNKQSGCNLKHFAPQMVCQNKCFHLYILVRVGYSQGRCTDDTVGICSNKGPGGICLTISLRINMNSIVNNRKMTPPLCQASINELQFKLSVTMFNQGINESV